MVIKSNLIWYETVKSASSNIERLSVCVTVNQNYIHEFCVLSKIKSIEFYRLYGWLALEFEHMCWVVCWITCTIWHRYTRLALNVTPTMINSVLIVVKVELSRCLTHFLSSSNSFTCDDRKLLAKNYFAIVIQQI